MVSFSFDDYRRAVRDGECNPPGAFPRFIKVDRASFTRMREESKPLKLSKVRPRLGEETFNRVRGALGLTLRHAHNSFPAYRFLIKQVVNNEWLAIVDWEDFQRDHLIHQAMSAYVGASLLRDTTIFSGTTRPSDFRGDTLLEKCVDALLHSHRCQYLRDYLHEMGAPASFFDDPELSKVFWEWMFLDTFFLAVFFHDIGYPWQFTRSIVDKLGPHSPVQDPTQMGIEGIIDKYGQRLVFYPLSGYRKPDPTEPANWRETLRSLLRQGLNETHGVPGAISFLYLNDKIRQSFDGDADSPVRRFCVEWAAMAVMMHDMAKIYTDVEDGTVKQKNPQLRLSLANDPLSFLLTLTDQIQDFARPDACFTTLDGDSAQATYRSRCETVDLDWNDSLGRLRIIYSYSNPGDYFDNLTEFLPKNQLRYFHPTKGYLEYTNIGINRIELNADLV